MKRDHSFMVIINLATLHGTFSSHKMGIDVFLFYLRSLWMMLVMQLRMHRHLRSGSI